MAGSTHSGKGPITGINITPMVDVMLVLLVILMVSANWMVQKQIRIDLPKAKSGEAASGPSAPPATVVIDKRGQVRLNGEVLASAAVAARFTALAGRDADQTVIISADREADHGVVVGVLDQARSAGLKRFAISVEATR